MQMMAAVRSSRSPICGSRCCVPLASLLPSNSTPERGDVMSSIRRLQWIPLCLAAATGVGFIACGGGSASVEPPPPELPLPAEVILVAGNIATCGTTNDDATAAVLDTLPGTIFTLGDNVFPDGSIAAYN